MLITYIPDMVRAKLAGRKTQTRRLIKEQPPEGSEIMEAAMAPGSGSVSNKWAWKYPDGSIHQIKCPYGRCGDLLLGREGYQITAAHSHVCNLEGFYLADQTKFKKRLTEEEFEKWGARKFPYRATAGRFMYKSLIRFRDVITEIRAQRVQNISEEDAKAEGVEIPRCPNCGYTLADCRFHLDHGLCAEDEPQSARDAFCDLWNPINWENNDWVFAITTRPEGS